MFVVGWCSKRKLFLSIYKKQGEVFLNIFSVVGYGDPSGQGWYRKYRLPRVPDDDGSESK